MRPPSFPCGFRQPRPAPPTPGASSSSVAPADVSIPGGIGTPSPASCSQIHASRSWHASAKVGPAENGNTSNRCNRASSSPLASLLVATTISRSGMCCSDNSSFSAAVTCLLTISSNSSTKRTCHGLPLIGRRRNVWPNSRRTSSILRLLAEYSTKPENGQTPRSWIRALAAALLPTPPGPSNNRQQGCGEATSRFSRRTMAGWPTTSSRVLG